MVSDRLNSRSGYRDRLQIMKDILIVISECDGGSKKTHIMYRANLSYSLLMRYLKIMLNAGLIENNLNSSLYEITDNGRTFLELYAKYERSRRRVKRVFEDIDNGRTKLEKMLCQ